MDKSKRVHGERPVNCLLVEGPNDQHVFFHLFEHHHIPETFRIEVKNGVEALLNDLDMELERSGLTQVGIVVDADNNLKPLGQAITARYLDADAPYAQKLVGWLRQLFNLT